MTNKESQGKENVMAEMYTVMDDLCCQTKMEAKYFIFFKKLSDEIHTLSKGK